MKKIYFVLALMGTAALVQAMENNPLVLHVQEERSGGMTQEVSDTLICVVDRYGETKNKAILDRMAQELEDNLKSINIIRQELETKCKKNGIRHLQLDAMRKKAKKLRSEVDAFKQYAQKNGLKTMHILNIVCEEDDERTQ